MRCEVPHVRGIPHGARGSAQGGAARWRRLGAPPQARGVRALAGGGQRWTVAATLAGREFERVAIDIGFAAEPVFEPEVIVSSHLLDFADITT